MKKGLELSTPLGFAIGLGGILVGYVLEGGSPASLVGVSALIIIVAGSLGALLVSFPMPEVLSFGKIVGAAFAPANEPDQEMGELIVTMADRARREGLLSLDDILQEIEDPMFKKGIRMVVDGVDPDEIEKIMDNDMAIFELKKKEEAEVMAQLGGFLPTMGIIGTVTGLVLVLSHLGGDTAELGHSIAVAFIATLYGIGFANLFALPIANKLKGKIKKEKLRMEMIVCGIFAIQRGESPMLVEEKMNSFLEEKMKRMGVE